MLDSALLATLVLGPMGDITKGVYVLLALHLQVLINGNTLVVLELETRVCEETCRGLHTGSHDDERAFNGVVVLENDRADFARVGFWGQEHDLLV